MSTDLSFPHTLQAKLKRAILARHGHLRAELCGAAAREGGRAAGSGGRRCRGGRHRRTPASEARRGMIGPVRSLFGTAAGNTAVIS